MGISREISKAMELRYPGRQLARFMQEAGLHPARDQRREDEECAAPYLYGNYSQCMQLRLLHDPRTFKAVLRRAAARSSQPFASLLGKLRGRCSLLPLTGAAGGPDLDDLIIFPQFSTCLSTGKGVLLEFHVAKNVKTSSYICRDIRLVHATTTSSFSYIADDLV